MTLPAEVNPPEYQQVLVSSGEPARSLVADAVSGADIASCLLWLPPTCLPAPAEDGLICSQLALLWYLLNPLFCERASSALG